MNELNAKAGCKAIVIHGSPFIEKGTPDILMCREGRFWAIEVKNEEGVLSRIQIVRLTQWRLAGAICAVVRDWSELQELLTNNRGNFKI